MALITRAQARTYIAQIIGGANHPNVLDTADDVISSTLQEWNNLKDWNFLLKDTAAGHSVTGVTIPQQIGVNPIAISAPSTGAFDAVNIGVTVSNANITTGTKVASYTRASDGSVATITLDAVTTNTSAAATNQTLVFSGDIPLIAGTNEYNLPLDIDKPYGARLTSNKWPLEYVQYREWNRKVNDQTVQGTVELYTIYNPLGWLTTVRAQKRLRVFRIPSQADTLHLQYYRNLDETADPVDMNPYYIYAFLNYCRYNLLLIKNAHDDRLPSLEAQAKSALQRVMTDDDEYTEDEDLRMKSQQEMGWAARPLWNNGPFYPDYGF